MDLQELLIEVQSELILSLTNVNLKLIKKPCSLRRGISFLLSSVVFHVVPTALEITMVCGILVSKTYLLYSSEMY